MFFCLVGAFFLTINLAKSSSSKSPPSFIELLNASKASSSSLSTSGCLKDSILASVDSLGVSSFSSTLASGLSRSKCQLDHEIVKMIMSIKVLSPS
jgi:hypothetical protein